MRPKVAPYLRMTRGGPPACADELQVRDLATGELVQDVIEADVSLRFVAVHARDGNGQLRFSDGKAVPERREGNFQIEYKDDPKDALAAQKKPMVAGVCFDRGEARHRWLLRCAQELGEEVQRIRRELLDRPSK